MNLIAVFSNISNITFIVLLAVVLSFFLPGAGSVFQLICKGTYNGRKIWLLF